MPKKRKDKKRSGGDGAAQNDGLVDEEMATDCDTMSVMSTQSEGSIAAAEEEVEETCQTQDDLEEKLKEVIDQLTQKSAQGRMDCLKTLQAAMSKKVMEEFYYDRKLTLADALEKCVRRGKGEEVYLAAHCFTLLLLQLGASADSEELFTAMRPHLQVIMADTAAGLKGRRGCADALGVGAFLAAAEIEDVVQTMTALEQIFRGSLLKGDGVAPSHSPEVSALHTSALLAWALLLTIAPPHHVQALVISHTGKVRQLLESGDVELRIGAGEVIALLYELARADDEDYEGSELKGLCDKLRSLATDSTKYRAKKERRLQRASFRDIVRWVGEWEEFEATRVRFGGGGSLAEELEIDSWLRRLQYNSLCHLLGQGMNAHLAQNELIRDVFELGPTRLVTKTAGQRTTKQQRHYVNAVAFKARTKARSKVRDKRSKVMGADS